ncbi:hypothetical protein J2W14_002367 [Pseudarthrobacter oxydans]|uniref:hypothetical protein n=1 Tax=Pseudarthrobacter oxydans TaxID=1671 RepID=UPI00277EA3A6|nr:hypothetical protein [Pseudarthrobacter oxydans]MDP9982965.1 hypothetical protein [Pseudarthrobacter oxydans]
MTAPTPTPTPSPTSGPGPAEGITPEQWAAIGSWIGDAFTNNSAQTVIALLALMLSVIALVSQFSRGRKADLSVRFAKTPDYKYCADRLVVTNHGAASAKNIRLALTVDLEARPAADNSIVSTPEIKDGKQPWRPWPHETGHDPFPVQVLAPGASLYIPINVYGNRPEEAAFPLAELTWKDKRIRRQTWTSTVSSTGQVLGGPSLENFHAEKQARLMSLMT